MGRRIRASWEFVRVGAIPVLTGALVADAVIALRLRRDYAKTVGRCVYAEHASVLGPLAWCGLGASVFAVAFALAPPRRTWRVATAVLCVLLAVPLFYVTTHCFPEA